jgi:hypothetical protein
MTRGRPLTGAPDAFGLAYAGRSIAARVVGVQFGIGDDAVGPDDVPRRHRQHPLRGGIAHRQVVAELLVDLDQIGGEFEAQSERSATYAAASPQNGEAELTVALGFAAVGRRPSPALSARLAWLLSISARVARRTVSSWSLVGTAEIGLSKSSRISSGCPGVSLSASSPRRKCRRTSNMTFRRKGGID